MSGYFQSLVKQSSVSIGASNSSAPVNGTALRPVTAEPVAPLHVDTVSLVGPTTGEVNHFEQRAASEQPAYEIGERFTSRDPISVESEAPGIASQLTDTRFDQSQQTTLDQPEPDLVRESSIVTEPRAETIPEVVISTNEVIEHRATKTTPGVVRVGETRNDTDQERVVESNVRTLARPELSIPPDYMEGIREWLTAAPATSDEIVTDRSIEQHDDHDSSTPKQSDRSLPPTIELDRSSHEELQEFSLSIGSISIVVEEPARQPPPSSTNLQPVERAPASAQPRARDAFALSRSYFRGF